MSKRDICVLEGNGLIWGKMNLHLHYNDFSSDCFIFRLLFSISLEKLDRETKYGIHWVKKKNYETFWQI